MEADLLYWCVEELQTRFSLSVSEDIVRYILSIDTEEEIDEYISDLVQGSEEKKFVFVHELKNRWRKTKQLPTPSAAQAYNRKEDVLQLQLSEQGKKGRRKGRNKLEPVPVQSVVNTVAEEVKTPMDLAKAQETTSLSSSKKKQKFVNLYTSEGQDRLAVLIPGRHPCECLAQKHKLINNCMTCGRIVCEQEGSGPCLFCGDLVCTREEQDILMRDSNKSQKLRKKLFGGSETPFKFDVSTKDLLPRKDMQMKEGYEKAMQHRDKLLEYDKTSIRRTHVIDDESDYFSTDSNQWLSQAEREALRKKEQELLELRHASRLSRKITIDFAGRKVLEEDDNLSEYHTRFDETVQAINSGTVVKSPRTGERSDVSYLVNPSMLLPPPMWVDQVSVGAHRKKGPLEGAEEQSDRNRLRIQDKELQEISDLGMCLSMHQPWASLLVAGIKRVEGRTWYSAHRGRLWIAAAAKRPSPQEISELETSYRVLIDKDVDFPKDYPTGCLLGCVEVVDCLPLEQFTEQYSSLSQESNSPFVFICTNPQELLLKFPMKGQHKIWRLDSKIHQAAKKGLMTRKDQNELSTKSAKKSRPGKVR
ncbi:activating signal cointegrator 1 isoform X1 [Pelobates cultripes]|uniref:Activating signal cointegrator 1 n=1 Tax=Pelobates cultripes TaxID=61616 RepID=A0AAD1RKK5_PELCU|nr:activating signal cointegrator 1 isoform X1 [Pelobates cultripes]